jgi:uncharacterized repeat protein (TIGR01451 family)
LQTGDPNEAGRCLTCDAKDAVAAISSNVIGRNFGYAFPVNPAATDADLSIVKSGTASVTSNGAVSYTLVVTNLGTASADGAVVTDPAVANFTATSVTCGSPSGGAVCPTVGNTTIALLQGAGIVIPTLPSGGSVTFTLNGTAGVSGSISNIASVAAPSGITDPAPANNSSTASTTITATVADLSIVKSGTATAASNGAVSYTLVVSNAGPAAADGAVVTDPAVANFTATSVTCGSPSGGAVCPTVGNTTIALLQGAGIVIPTLPSGGSVTFTLNGTAGVSGSISNIANVATPSGITDPAPANNSSTASTTITATVADLSIVKSGTATAASNGAVSYTLVVSNAGPAAADGAVVTDPAVANFTATSVTCGSPSGGAVCPTVGNTTIALLQGAGIVIPTLPSGGSVTFTLNGTAAASGSISNIASVATPPGIGDPTPANNSSTAGTTISATVADLLVQKSGPATVAVNGAVSYTLQVVNLGPGAANGATVTDTPPAGLGAPQLVACVASGGASCPALALPAPISGSWTLPTLPAGGSVTLTLAGSAPAAPATLTNVVAVSPPAGVSDRIPPTTRVRLQRKSRRIR